MGNKLLKLEILIKNPKFMEELQGLLQRYDMGSRYMRVYTPDKQVECCCPACEAYRPTKVVATVQAEFPLRRQSDGTEYIDSTEGRVLYTEDFPEIAKKAITRARFCERCGECVS